MRARRIRVVALAVVMLGVVVASADAAVGAQRASMLNRDGGAGAGRVLAASRAQFLDLSLSAGRLTYLNSTTSGSPSTGSLWQRLVTATVRDQTKLKIGTQQRIFSVTPLATSNPLLYSRAPVSTSAGRSLVPPLAASELEPLVYQLLDRGVVTHRLPVTTLEGFGVRQSGPYSVVGRRVYRSDGLLLLNLDDQDTARLDIFGPQVIYSSSDGTVRLRDLTVPGSTITLAEGAGCAACAGEVAIWGTTVAWVRPDGRVAVRTLPSARVRVVTTGSMFDLRLSAGAMSWHNSWHDDSVSVLNLRSARSSPQSLPLRAAEVDDHLVAGLNVDTGLNLTVRALPFGLRTKFRPRLIGVFAPASFASTGAWSPQIDVTKPVTSVRLTLSLDGHPVRVLTGTAPDGSIRNLTWDGTDDVGFAAAPGQYTWTLTATAKDGEGTLTAADGISPVTGTVTLTR